MTGIPNEDKNQKTKGRFPLLKKSLFLEKRIFLKFLFATANDKILFFFFFSFFIFVAANKNFKYTGRTLQGFSFKIREKMY
jgi:hypothetical protein